MYIITSLLLYVPLISENVSKPNAGYIVVSGAGQLDTCSEVPHWLVLYYISQISLRFIVFVLYRNYVLLVCLISLYSFECIIVLN